MRSFACKVAFAAAAACSLAGTAFGQPASNPPADIWSRPTLTGDWGGLRPWLAKHGITITLDYTVELLANLQGGAKRGEVVLGLFQPQVDVDLEKLWGLQGARFRAGGIFTHGPAFSVDFLGNNISTASNIDVQRPVNRLYELWYEQNAFDDRFSVRAGLLRVDTEFITSETAFMFVNATLGWQGWVAAVLPAGGPAYPFSAPGVRVKVKPRDDVYLQAAVFSGDPAEFDGSNQPQTLPTGTILSFRGGAWLIAETGYTPNQQKGPPGCRATTSSILVPHQQAFRRPALRQYRPVAGGSDVERGPARAHRQLGHLRRRRPDAVPGARPTTRGFRRSFGSAAAQTIAIRSVSISMAASSTKA